MSGERPGAGEPTRHVLFHEGDALYDDMLDAIAAARERVWMESYIFAADGVGRRFGAALARAARRGLDTRLHIDAAGSLFLAPAGFLATLRNAGVLVREFHRWSWRDPWRYNRRNHCKLLLIDDGIVYLGGFNIHKECSRRLFGPLRWRDTHVRLQSRRLGSEAADIYQVFWDRRIPAPFRARIAADPPGEDSLVSNRTPRQRNALRRMFRHSIGGARQRVWLTTPYFSPDRRTRRHLYEAAQQAVDVRVLLPAVSDRRFMRMTARHIYARFLAAGVRVFEYRPRVLHAKTMVVDHELATIGTANLDHRSLFHNYEINYVSKSPVICRELAEQFLLDLEDSVEITAPVLGRRGLVERLVGYLGWSLRRWL